MPKCVRLSAISLLLLFVATECAFCGRLMGEVTQVTETTIKTSFPARVRAGSMMMVMSGKGESIAAVAISQYCDGSGPYDVTGRISWVSEPMSLKIGKDVYINSENASAIPSKPAATTAFVGSGSGGPVDQDLKLYYYVAGQNVGYGALGVGFERTVKVNRTLGVEADAGISAVGNVNSTNADVINTDQLIKTLNGRVKLDFSPGFGVYTGYRWSEGRGDDDRWDRISGNLAGKPFTAPSVVESGTVLLQGMEYGLTFRPLNKLTLSAGFIPALRTDYGGLGVMSQPAYTGELRFGTKQGAVRLRGIRTEDYWTADLGITIK